MAEPFGFRRCSQQTIQEAAGGHSPRGKQDAHSACSPQSPLFLAPGARHGLHGPPSTRSSGTRPLGFLPKPWSPHTHRPGSLPAPGTEPCALTAQWAKLLPFQSAQAVLRLPAQP